MHCFFFYLFIFKKYFIIFGIYEFLKIENRIINIASLNKLFKKLNKFTDINKLYKFLTNYPISIVKIVCHKWIIVHHESSNQNVLFILINYSKIS